MVEIYPQWPAYRDNTMPSQRKNTKRSLFAFTFACASVAVALAYVQLVLFTNFGAFASKSFRVTAEYKPVSGAYRQLTIEADGVVQPGIDSDPESDEVRIAFVSNGGAVTRYNIKDIVWRPHKHGGKLYRDDGTLLSGEALAAKVYAPLIAGFYNGKKDAPLLPEAGEVAGMIYQAGWMSETTYRNPATQQFLILESLACEYRDRWWQAPATPFVAMFLFWLCSVLSNPDGRGPRRFYLTKKGFSWGRRVEKSDAN